MPLFAQVSTKQMVDFLNLVIHSERGGSKVYSSDDLTRYEVWKLIGKPVAELNTFLDVSSALQSLSVFLNVFVLDDIA